MGTIQDKLDAIEKTKEKLRARLIDLGYSVDTTVPFKSYPNILQDYINSLGHITHTRDANIIENVSLKDYSNAINSLIDFITSDTMTVSDSTNAWFINFIPESIYEEVLYISDNNLANNITNKSVLEENIKLLQVISTIIKLPDYIVKIDETYKNGAQTLNFGASANAIIKSKKEITMDKLSMKGIIEVELLDKDTGELKQKEVIHNTITDAYKSWVLYTMMTQAPFGVLSRAAASTNVPTAPQLIGTLGLYVMDKSIEIKPRTFIPPYLTKRVSATPPSGDAGISNVSFYNVGGSTTETTKELIPVDTNCYLNTNNEYQLQYTKNTGQGTVTSVVIGRTHRVITGTVNQYSVFTKDTTYNPDIYTAGNLAPYAIEQTDTGTVIHKQKLDVASGVISINTKTKDFSVQAPGGNMFTNLTTYPGGIIANNTLFSLRSQGTISGLTRTTTLTYVKNWKNLATAETLVLTIPLREGITSVLPLAANTMPILVGKDNNTIEVFVTMSVGDHPEGEGIVNGANVWKAVIDISEIGIRSLTASDVTYVDCGVIPYVIGYLNVADGANNISTYVQGFYFGGKYYLPISGEVIGTTNVAASINNSVIAAYQEGAIFGGSLNNFEDYYCVRNVGGNNLIPVDTETGWQQILANLAGPLLFYTGSQVISGATLENPIIKTADDILRVTYKYSLSDIQTVA